MLGQNKIRAVTKVATATMAATALVGLGATGAGAAQVKSRTVKCTGVVANAHVRADLVVPAGASCALDRVRVSGNVTVHGNLLAGKSDVRGRITVAKDGYLNLWETRVRGHLTVDKAYGMYLDRTRLDADLRNTDGSIPVATYVTTTDISGSASVVTPPSHGYGPVLENSRVGGDLTGIGYFHSISVDDIRVGGNVSLNGHSGTSITNSIVRGDTAAVAPRGSSLLRANRLTNVHVTGLSAEFSDNHVSGVADGAFKMHLWGSGNAFWGQVKGRFAECFPGGVPDSVPGCPGSDTVRASVAPTVGSSSVPAQLKARTAEAKAQARQANGNALSALTSR